MSGRADAAAPRLLFLVTEDWYFCSHRLPLACAARDDGFAVTVATRVTSHAERILDQGFALEPVSLRRGDWRVWRDLGTLRRLHAAFARAGPEIVHNVALKPIVYGSLLARRRPSVRGVVNAFAGLGFVFTSSRVSARLLRPTLRAGLKLALAEPRSHCIVQNPDDQALLERLGIPSARIHRIPGSGVDVTRFAPSPEPAGPVVVTMVARMLRDKGVEDLVAAARIVRAREPAIQFWLVGPPDPDNPASIAPERLRGWDAEGVVRWLGPRDDVPALLGRSHIAVLPSYREGMPRSLLEAAACARPLVAYDVPGCREIVRHADTGRRAPARDRAALADAILHLAGDKEERVRLGRNARALVEREFSTARVIADTLRLYRSLLDAAS